MALAAAGLLRAEDRPTGGTAAPADVLVKSEPMLQCPAETTMGVVWAVGAMATGEVEVSDNADFADSKTVRTDGYGLVGFDDRVVGRHEFVPRAVCSQVGLDRLAEQSAVACDETFATKLSRRNFRRVAS